MPSGHIVYPARNGNPSHPVFILTQRTKAAIDQYDYLNWDWIENLIQSASRNGQDWRYDWESRLTPEEGLHLQAVLDTLKKDATPLFALRLMYCFRYDADLPGDSGHVY